MIKTTLDLNREYPNVYQCLSTMSYNDTNNPPNPHLEFDPTTWKELKQAGDPDKGFYIKFEDHTWPVYLNVIPDVAEFERMS